MAKYVAKDVYVLVNGTAITDHARNVTVEDKSDEVELTAFGTGAYKQIAQGFHDATMTVEFFSDFDPTTGVHPVLYPIYSGGGTCSVEIRPTSAARGTANPAAYMVARMFDYSPLAGAVGAAATFTATFRNAGTAGVTWLTS